MINVIKFLKLRSISSFIGVRFTSLNCVNLVGRSYLTPTDLSSEEIKSLLWTAIDLKCLLGQKIFNPSYLKCGKITLLMHDPCYINQGSAMSAANIMNSHLNVIIDPTWDTVRCIRSLGKIISSYSDLIFCKSKYQSKLKYIVESSDVPVVSISTGAFSILDCLADLMTIQEKYGHLNGLNLGWIGEPTPLMNTFMCTALKIGINIKYHCACGSGEPLSPSMLPSGEQISKVEPAVLKECPLPATALDKADVIVIADYNIITTNNLKLEDLDAKANKNWSLITYLPSPEHRENESFCNHPNSLVWHAKANLQWIYASIMLRFINTYKHCTEMPNFDKTSKS